jgi:hypothetical protein
MRRTMRARSMVRIRRRKASQRLSKSPSLSCSPVVNLDTWNTMRIVTFASALPFGRRTSLVGKMPTKRKKPAKKKSPPGDTNWLRKFYQLCGFEPERAELVFARSSPLAFPRNGATAPGAGRTPCLRRVRRALG